MDVKDVRWGYYEGFEGPWYPGRVKFLLPNSPSSEQLMMSVITATEGGALDAINHYDRCIDTQGVIQWCNRAPTCFVDQIYSKVNLDALEPVLAFARERGYRFNYSAGHFAGRDGELINTPERQTTMYFDGASGLKGAWTEGQKAYAKSWVAAAADVWQSPQAQEAQINFTLSRMGNFFVYGPVAKRTMAAALRDRTPLAQAFYAAYLSFAANNPKKAGEALAAAIDGPAKSAGIFSLAWLIEVLKSLTFHSGIAIYPDRYNKIRPVIERIYEVDLPDFAAELKNFQVGSFVRFKTPRDIQEALLTLGYDLGPKRADNSFGAKSTSAFLKFELDAGVLVERADGIPDAYSLTLLEEALDEIA